MDTTENGTNPVGSGGGTNGKRGVGRPKADDSKKKSAKLEVVGSAHEIKQIKLIHQQLTYGRQISVSEFIRTLVFAQVEKRPGQESARMLREGPLLGILRNDIHSVRKYLQSISTNYNQTVKRINSLPASKRLIDELNEQHKYVSDTQGTLLKLNNLINDITKQLRSSGEDH